MLHFVNLLEPNTHIFKLQLMEYFGICYMLVQFIVISKGVWIIQNYIIYHKIYFIV